MLTLVAVPIGNAKDITLRALEIFQAADVVIGEERKEVSKLLKAHAIVGKRMELLNEHSRPDDLKDLVELCRTLNVALVSDAGTPGFCDPGAQLVAACRKEKIPVTSSPGASSLMTLLSLSGRRLDKFVFEGFLPAEREERERSLRHLAKETRPLVLMDTPYRLNRLLDDLARTMPKRHVILGLDLTAETEQILEGSAESLSKKLGDQKREFILVVI